MLGIHHILLAFSPICRNGQPWKENHSAGSQVPKMRHLTNVEPVARQKVTPQSQPPRDAARAGGRAVPGVPPHLPAHPPRRSELPSTQSLRWIFFKESVPAVCSIRVPMLITVSSSSRYGHVI